MCQRYVLYATLILLGDSLTTGILGAFDDLSSVAEAFRGVYGAWVNTDGFTVGEQKELYAGFKIFEIAKRTPSVRHYVWSNLDYATKVCLCERLPTSLFLM